MDTLFATVVSRGVYQCHRCHRPIPAGDGIARMKVRRGVSVSLDEIPRYHAACVPPVMYWDSPEGRQRKTQQFDEEMRQHLNAEMRAFLGP